MKPVNYTVQKSILDSGILRALCCILILSLFATNVSSAQQFKTPVDYLSYLSEMDANLTRKYLDYISTVAHSNSGRKMEKRRAEVVQSIQTANRDLGRLRPFNGDAELRDAYREYYKILFSVFNEDYHKIVDMEEIAEQSYDAMEAYMLAQEKASEKLAGASEKMAPAYNKFAADNNIRLSEKESKNSKKMRQVGLVNKYNQTLYLIFFKSFKQEVYLTTALSGNDISGAEQNKNTLIKYVDEGFAKLDTIRPFKGDGSLVNACRRTLEFHKLVALKSQQQIDMLVKFDEFGKIKKAFEAKSERQRTKTDIDTYSKAIEEHNATVKKYNQLSEELNKTRSKVYESWDASRKRFLGAHVPQS